MKGVSFTTEDGNHRLYVPFEDMPGFPLHDDQFQSRASRLSAILWFAHHGYVDEELTPLRRIKAHQVRYLAMTFLQTPRFVRRVARELGLLPRRRAVASAARADVLACGLCVVCGSTDRLEVDHIVPVSRGGSDERKNLRALCRTCNLSKGGQLDSEWRAV